MEELWRFIERLCEKVWQVSIGALVYMFNAIAPIHDILTAGVGAAYTPQGFQPTVGVGVGIILWQF